MGVRDAESARFKTGEEDMDESGDVLFRLRIGHAYAG